ncbi:MAG: hypothetical protein SOX26_09550 [Phocaeicola sp.]|nr:hypothetical protein [Phocaeicola sp.]
MKTMWKMLKQRYKDMGYLLYVVWVIMIFVAIYYCPIVIRHIMAGGDELMLGLVYSCNLLTLFILFVNVIRIDCRNLLSEKTASLLENMGSFIVFLMIVRHLITSETGELGDDLIYSMDWITIFCMGLILQFVGKIVRRAIKIKEENDLKI